MPRPALLLCCAVLLLFISCQTESSTSTQQGILDDSLKPKSSTEEDNLMFQLSAFLIAEPRTQTEKEQNQIVDYAIENIVPIKRAPSGLFYSVAREGEGDSIEWGDYLQVNYKGYFLDGKVFDASILKGKPLEFYVGNMIPTWNEGLQLLKPGGQILLLAPSKLAYGEKGLKNKAGDYVIPPNTPLVFEIEVLKRLKKAE